jgi:Icc-related predicted phosphoesterase
MRLLLAADIHYNLRQMAWLEAEAGNYDAVILAGDLLDVTGHAPLAKQRRTMQEALRLIAARSPVLVASGNHDVDDAGGADWLREVAGHHLFVDGSTVAWNGAAVTLWPWQGTGAAPLPHGAAHDLPGLTRIWVHHAPPAGTRVGCCAKGKPPGGSAALTDRIRRHAPQIVVSGHIHDAPFRPQGGWWDRVGDTVCLNPGRQHGHEPSYIVVDLDAGELGWFSASAREHRPLPAPAAARVAGVA